jgi:Protein of unknown function (DUF2842)
MALSYAARKRWSLVILLIGLPVYIVVAVNVIDLFDRPAIWLELLVYLGLGVLWALPFKFLFKGIAQRDPDAHQAQGQDPLR